MNKKAQMTLRFFFVYMKLSSSWLLKKLVNCVKVKQYH